MNEAKNYRKSYLEDDFFYEAKSYEDFVEAAQFIESVTLPIPMNLRDTALYYYNGINQDGKLCYYEVAPGIESERVAASTDSLPVRKLKMDSLKEVPAAAVQHLSEHNLMMIVGTKVFFMSEQSIPSANQRAKCDCEFFNKNSLVRALAIRESIDRFLDFDVVSITRIKGKLRKVFYVGSKDYTYIPETTMIDVIEACKRERNESLEFVTAKFQQDYTDVILKFDEVGKRIKTKYKKDLTPAIMISSSSTGKGKFYVRSIWLRGNHYVIEDEYSKVHRGKFDVDKELGKAMEKIFPDFFVFPEKLLELEMQDVTTTLMDETTAEEAYRDAVKKVFMTLELTNIVGQKGKSKILSEFYNSYNPSIQYTMYDIIELFLDLPARCTGLDRARTVSLQKACGKAVYTDYSRSNITILP